MLDQYTLQNMEAQSMNLAINASILLEYLFFYSK